jgi:FAD/FMN-containing dehydrogenase
MLTLHQTVGIVGWATSGGHGWLTSSYGQGADNIYEIEIVTPRGEVLIANECQNSDIFWASRGGGGGTYGVITKITMKAYPMPKTTIWQWNFVSQNASSEDGWWKFVADAHALLVDINDKGFQGYYVVSGEEKAWNFGGWFLAYDKTNATVQQTLAPLHAMLNGSTNVATISAWNLEYYDTWISAYNRLPEQTSTDSDGGPGGTVSVTRLLTRDGLINNTAASANMFKSIAPSAEDKQVSLRMQ